jgi:hypothetical protein
MPQLILDRQREKFDELLSELQEATSLSRPAKAQKLASQIDLLSTGEKGLKFLYQKALAIEEAGFFDGTAWAEPTKQVPSLVKGTLLAGHPSSSYEIISELRLLAYAHDPAETKPQLTAFAKTFLEEVLVLNLEFAFDELSESSRNQITPQERKKVVHHFQFLMRHASLDGIKQKLLEEIKMVCAQRPLVTDTVRNLILTVYQKIDLEEDQAVDQELQFFINALYFPGPLVEQYYSFKKYEEVLENASEQALLREAKSIGNYLQKTGLTNPYLAIFLLKAVVKYPDLVPHVLHLNETGQEQWSTHQAYLKELIKETFSAQNFRGIYGLKRLLERSLLSMRAVRVGITNLRLITINHQAEQGIIKSVGQPSDQVSARQYLMAALLGLLGQPLGIGQGSNATCQSARGLSMWAQHAPGKLINMVTTVATANNLIIRFENEDLESIKLGKGLVDQLDHRLDAVSVLLVPHLDKIYNEMMRRSAHRGEDPHKWTNPGLYGAWIQHDFASAYSYLTNSIQDFEGFIKLFYWSLHPEYNGGRKMVYPNPVGIFITSSQGEMLGFHAVSLLRLAQYEGRWRAYFLNPNNEGRQDWGQGIEPSVYGQGERHGESSLPLEHFLARVYAFHFNRLALPIEKKCIPADEVKQIENWAKSSWGQKYQWRNIERIW